MQKCVLFMYGSYNGSEIEQFAETIKIHDHQHLQCKINGYTKKKLSEEQNALLILLRNFYADGRYSNYSMEDAYDYKLALENFVKQYYDASMVKTHFFRKDTYISEEAKERIGRTLGSDDDILQLFEVMNKANWHTFQVLTKRPDRLIDLSPKITWTPNIWMGVTVENSRALERVEKLKRCGARIKFVSAEPLLESISHIDLNGIDWLIVGGESGAGCRPLKKEWVVELRDIAKKSNTPFFFKQWGGFHHSQAGSELDGVEYKEYPRKIAT